MNINKKMSFGTISLILLSLSIRYLINIFSIDKTISLAIEAIFFGLASGWFLASLFISKYKK